VRVSTRATVKKNVSRSSPKAALAPILSKGFDIGIGEQN
jgi:hypothetical protein